MKAFKSILAAALIWMIGAVPAFAGAIGFLGNSLETYGAGTSVTMNYPFSVAAGNFAAAFLGYGAGNIGVSCTDTQGNTWTNEGFAQGVFAANVQTNWSFLSHSVTTSDSVTCTNLGGNSGMLGHLGIWSNVANLSNGGTNAYAGNATTSAVTTLATGIPGGSAQCSTGTTGCTLIICNAFFRSTTTTSLDGAWTNLQSGAGANWATGYIIQANGTPHNCTGTGVAADRMAIEQLIFNSTTGGGGSTPKPMFGSIP